MTNEPDEHPDEPTPAAGQPSSPGGETSPPPPPAPSASPAPSGAETQPKRLTRSREDEWFGGVAGGLAEYFDTDSTLIRIAFVVAALVTSGFAILGYIVAWIVIPEAPAAAGATTSRRRSSNTGALLWGGILIIGGTLFLLAQLDLNINLPSWEVGLSAALIFVGVLMLIEARHGFHGGLVSLAVILTVLLGVSHASNFNLAVDGAFGESSHSVTSVEDLQSDYSHAFGSLTLDLRDLDLPEGTTEVEVSMVFGEATILLPADVEYRVDASSVFGSIDAPQFDADGVASSRTYTSPGYDEADRRLDFDLSVVFGSGRID